MDKRRRFEKVVDDDDASSDDDDGKTEKGIGGETRENFDIL